MKNQSRILPAQPLHPSQPGQSSVSTHHLLPCLPALHLNPQWLSPSLVFPPPTNNKTGLSQHSHITFGQPQITDPYSPPCKPDLHPQKVSSTVLLYITSLLTNTYHSPHLLLAEILRLVPRSWTEMTHILHQGLQ